MSNRAKELPLGGHKSGSKPLQFETSFSHWRSLVAAGIIIAAGVLAYHNSFGGPFIFDDRGSISENPNIRQLWPIWEVTRAPQPGETVAGRPILSLSLALNYQIGGLEVRSYHLVNLAIHILAALTLFAIIRRTLLSARLRERFGRASFSLALICALLWLVHPLQTASVSYIVQRAESLMGLFYLLSLYCAIRGFSSGSSRWWYSGAIAACVLGVGTKEVAATAPLMILLYDRIFVSRSFKEIFSRRRGLYLGLAGAWVIFGVISMTAPRGTSVAFDFPGLTSLDYAMTQCKVIVLYYLKLSFWPHPLVFDYGWPIVKNLGDVVPYALVLAVLLIGTLVAFRYRPGLGFLGVWFFVILGPSSSFLPIVTEVVAEHRMYLPLAAVVVAVVVCGYAFGAELTTRLAAANRRWLAVAGVLGYAIAVIIVVVLGSLTVRRNHDYRSALSIWEDTVAKQPDNARSYNNRGGIYFMQGRYESAMADFNRAIELHPRYAMAHKNMSLALIQQGKIKEAISHCRQALRLRSDWPEVLNNLAWLLATHKDSQIRDAAEAIRLAGRACELTNYNQAESLDTLAAAYAEVGQFAKAIETAEKAIQSALTAGKEDLAKDTQKRLELYKAKRPYREPFTPQDRTNPRPKE